ncbi:hypothetical protein HPB47_015024 [Ixodes persulcatus]|uniref:Uncharacterized protein n=1 Tax=Ixodes persulcatus TaxID=34615 RepID=A0AC60QUU2_IXOPE|nr:hypothetical protein HPB47_015024 [Ixodes persulcatus]
MVIACLIIAVTSYMCHATSFALTARIMDHWCRPPDDINMSTSQWKNIAIPVTEDGRNSQCSMYSSPLKTENSSMRTLIPCTEWDFDLEEYGSTIISEWSLVCSRSWLVHLASLMFHMGAAIGGVVFGTAADHMGRRPVAYFCIVIHLLAGFGSGQHNSFLVFVTVRFMVAASSDALMKVLFVILYEVSSPHKWLMYSFLCGFVPLVIVPAIIVPLTLFKFSWIAVHTIIMIPTSLLVVAFYFIQESPRWLLATGNIQEARKVVILAAATNHASLKIAKQSLKKAEVDMKGVAAENERTPPLTIKEMFVDPIQKKRSGVLFFAWFAVDFAFSVNILRGYFVYYQSFTIAYVVFVPLGVRCLRLMASTYLHQTAGLHLCRDSSKTVLGNCSDWVTDAIPLPALHSAGSKGQRMPFMGCRQPHTSTGASFTPAVDGNLSFDVPCGLLCLFLVHVEDTISLRHHFLRHCSVGTDAVVSLVSKAMAIVASRYTTLSSNVSRTFAA